MKLHAPLICSQKIFSIYLFSLLDYNSFQPVASLAIEGLKQ
jgi:hypothetical protein